MINNNPLIIAHRGASASAPENTLAAFQRAIDDKADGIEFDVRLAKDGVPVVFHDSTLKRLAKIKGCVNDFTAAELGGIDVGSWFNKSHPEHAADKFCAETVPTLEVVLNFLREYKNLVYIELKGKESVISELSEAVCSLLKSTNLMPNVVVKSFKLEGVKTTKRILPEVRTAALFEPKVLTILRKKKRILEEAKKCHADEISIHYSLATEKFVRRAREQGFPTAIWTANSRAWVKHAFDAGIKAIITNKPAQLLAKREEILKDWRWF